MSHSTTTRSATEEKALKLLGSGYTPQVVASACGVSVSRISQLLSEEDFAAQIAELRFENLQKHNRQDEKYDAIEEKLTTMLDDLLPLMLRPNDILKAISVINGAKRRGAAGNAEVGAAQNTVVNLVMPSVIVNKFTTNINNQVIQAGSQTLETVQATSLNERLKNFKALEEQRTIENRVKTMLDTKTAERISYDERTKIIEGT